MQRKKEVHYYDLGTDTCKMQDRVPKSSMFSVCKHIYTNKFIMITFPENSLWVSPSVWLRTECKTYSFAKQKYFTPIEMIYNTCRVC